MSYLHNQPVQVLLIEDDPGDIELFRIFLAEQKFYMFNIVWAEDLQEGLQQLQQHSIDVILLDLSLPDSQGLHTFTTVNINAPGIPIVVLTGFADDNLALDAVRQGAQDYLVKGKLDGNTLSRVIRYAIERKRAAEALRESEERFRSAFDYAAIGMALIHLDGRWMQVNHNVCALLGYTEVELYAISFQDITHPDDREADINYYQQLLAGNIRYYHLEKRYIHKQGHPVWVMLSVSLIRDAQGKPLYFVAQIQDINRRKQVEAELARRLAELARSNVELERFAYVASHDLQEPLRMVASYTQLIERRYKDKLDTDANEFIAYAVDGVLRMQQLINALLEFARVDTRGKAFVPTDCNILLEQTIIDQKHAIQESETTITYDHLPTVMGDAAQLRRVFQNLLNNAIKFRSTKPPSIHVSAQSDNELWVFSIRDNGIGIAAEYIERIFVIFQRLHNRGEYDGTGIGLAICKKIIERHDGRIWVESQAGQGSTFYFTIPMVPRNQTHTHHMVHNYHR